MVNNSQNLVPGCTIAVNNPLGNFYPSRVSEPQVTHELTQELSRVLDALPNSWLLVDPEGFVIRASAGAEQSGVIILGRLEEPQMRDLVSAARESRDIIDTEIVIGRTRTHPEQTVTLRLAAINGFCLILMEDVTDERRLDAMRRQFVANISHELKTPVGALSLLAEAIEAAADDPETVAHFTGRMRKEADRLSSLVIDLIDLSRLQDDEMSEHMQPVNVDEMVTSALDAVQMLAEAKDIEMVVGGTGNLTLFGVRDQLASALRNLLTNAIHYSHPATRVAIGTSLVDGIVEISVVDQGIGIPPSERERIFERFYRVDPARSRLTGGTGLGLAIVKHVCASHGGDCLVWSQPDQGSTFTMRIPQDPTQRKVTDVVEGESAS